MAESNAQRPPPTDEKYNQRLLLLCLLMFLVFRQVLDDVLFRSDQADSGNILP